VVIDVLGLGKGCEAIEIGEKTGTDEISLQRVEMCRHKEIRETERKREIKPKGKRWSVVRMLLK
jgi:hypothetical protein